MNQRLKGQQPYVGTHTGRIREPHEFTAARAPRALSIIPASAHYDKEWCEHVDKVYVDGVHVPNCVAYDMDMQWAFGKDARGNWQPKLYGVVTVTVTLK